MKQHPQTGWCVFSRSSRSEWPIPDTFRWTRRDCIAAYKEEMARYKMPDRTFEKRVRDGSIRVGKAVVMAAPDR